jgi:hypothetical protein
MLNLRRLTIILLALIVTVSLASPSFAARKRKVVQPAVDQPVADTEEAAPAPVKKKAAPAPVVEEVASPAASDVNRNEEVLFSFNKDTAGWEIPDWAFEKPQDYVASSVGVSNKSLEIKVNFPGKRWTGAYIEYVEYLNWDKYSEVACDVYVPANAPMGLMAKIILTQGEDWAWVEMRKPIPLIPGKWTTIRANLLPGSTDWKRVQPTEEWRTDIRKFGIRVESDKKAAYNGSVYIGNIRTTIKEH